jgi:hypothetical protein
MPGNRANQTTELKRGDNVMLERLLTVPGHVTTQIGDDSDEPSRSHTLRKKFNNHP